MLIYSDMAKSRACLLYVKEVASVGNQHAADDAGDRDASERFREKVAEVMREKGTWRRGHRPQRRDA